MNLLTLTVANKVLISKTPFPLEELYIHPYMGRHGERCWTADNATENFLDYVLFLALVLLYLHSLLNHNAFSVYALHCKGPHSWTNLHLHWTRLIFTFADILLQTSLYLLSLWVSLIPSLKLSIYLFISVFLIIYGFIFLPVYKIYHLSLFKQHVPCILWPHFLSATDLGI